ncbi:MAG: hypothetical protein JNK87_12765 [Bryobacterales bacterium]|nr:hypothetical protein [Bryobacterales bacterium]
MMIRVFVGSGDASRIERGVLEYSLARHATQPYELYIYNGTRGVVERNGEVVWQRETLGPVRGHKFATEFSLFRYLIPELCRFEGRAIYLDSDMIALGDIAELANWPLPDAAWFAAVPHAYPEIGPHRWALSVMVIDCSRCRFDLPAAFRGIEQRAYTYSEFSQMAPRYLARYPIPIAELARDWNVFDAYDNTTRLIHYTDLDRQPWRFRYHPAGDLWHDYFQQALQSGFLTDALVEQAIAAGHVRDDLRLGPNGRPRRTGALAALVVEQRLRLRNGIRWLAYRSGWAR